MVTMQFVHNIVVGEIVWIGNVDVHSYDAYVYTPKTDVFSNLYYETDEDIADFVSGHRPSRPPGPDEAIWSWRFYYTDTLSQVGDHCLVTDSQWEILPISYGEDEYHRTFTTKSLVYGDRIVPAGYTYIRTTRRKRKSEMLYLDEETDVLVSDGIEYGRISVDGKLRE